ncbi:Retrovirus-related Pol polyprotein from transposon RE1 [Bienertia sinuspersici]
MQDAGKFFKGGSVNLMSSVRASGSKRNSGWYYDHCKMSGHGIDRCYKLHGYPPSWNNNREKRFSHLAQIKEEGEAMLQPSAPASPAASTTASNAGQGATAHITVEQYQHLVQLLNKQQTESNDKPSARNAFLGGNTALFSGYKFCMISSWSVVWVIDSGATHHICNDLSFFSECGPMMEHENTITVPDGRKVEIKHVGTVKLPGDIKLEHVFHVPDFQFNLVSISKLCGNLGCEVIFTSDSCMLQGPHWTHPLLLGRLVRGLYCTTQADKEYKPTNFEVQSVANVSCQSENNAFAVENAKLWHLRLGHLPFQQIKKLKELEVDIGLYKPDCICQICPAARQTRLSFPVSKSISLMPFELIHVDVWGP